MISLDEAIIHCEEKAKELREDVEKHTFVDAEDICDCIECAEEHEQLAEWLKELREWRKLKLVCANEGIVVYKLKENKE